MTLAEQWGLREPGSNPCRVRKFGSRRRERLFSDMEVAQLLNAAEKLAAAGTITVFQLLGIKLLFATGCRVGEIAGLEWSFVNFEDGVIAWPDSKTGSLTKPLTEEARALLEAAPRIAGASAVPIQEPQGHACRDAGRCLREDDGGGRCGGKGECNYAPDPPLVLHEDLF